VLSVPGTGYFLMMNAQNAILKEKQNKLFALAKLMDQRLEKSFDEILSESGSLDAPRLQKIAVLNSILKADTDAIADAEPGIGVGYYSRQLDAIITYGPSKELGHKVGQSISQTHQGRKVMETGLKMVQTAVLVRGNIMNCMYPVIRDKETIGYIWANELVEDINRQTEKLRNKFYAIIFTGVFISFVASILIAGSVANKVKRVKNGLKAIQEDLDYRIIPRKGEIGEIITAINEMAAALSKRKKLEEQMQKADKMAALGEVAAGVAHEIRNPLTAIRGFIQLIEENTDNHGKNNEYASIAIFEVDRLNKIVEELLYYARPSEPRKVHLDINSLLDSVLTLLHFKFEKQGVVVEKKFLDPLPDIPIDEEQIRQVFINLIINAAQAMENGGKLLITTETTADDFVRVHIEDSGPGIEQENIKRLSDPFFTTRENGTGLGLAVVQRIIDMHNGFMEVAVSRFNGAKITLNLPMTKRETNG
ncbi:MAG: ATP-binding protein, partial [Desulfobacula sp.]|nr:ATP-binding protein [Desulfobacula sp.]